MESKYLQVVYRQLNELYDFACENGLLYILSLSSSRESQDELYLGGIRMAETFLLVSIVNLSQKDINSLSLFINTNVNAVLVDVEKKHPFEVNISSLPNSKITLEPTFSNIYAAAYELCKETYIIPWSPSRLTADSAISRIRHFNSGNLSGKNVSMWQIVASRPGRVIHA